VEVEWPPVVAGGKWKGNPNPLLYFHTRSTPAPGAICLCLHSTYIQIQDCKTQAGRPYSFCDSGQPCSPVVVCFLQSCCGSVRVCCDSPLRCCMYTSLVPKDRRSRWRRKPTTPRVPVRSVGLAWRQGRDAGAMAFGLWRPSTVTFIYRLRLDQDLGELFRNQLQNSTV